MNNTRERFQYMLDTDKTFATNAIFLLMFAVPFTPLIFTKLDE